MRFLKRWPLIFLFALAAIVLSAGGYFFCLPAAHRPGPVDWLAATMSFFRMYWSWPQ